MAVTSASKANDPSGDFKGDIKVNNNPPTKTDLEKVEQLPVLDIHKKSHTFKSLWADDEHGPRRVLVVFIRHFFCGNCQEYLRTLSSSLTPSSLSQLSPPTSVVVIGCGTPDLIPMYIKETGCPFPIYADPTRQLYHKLGMTMTLNLGPKNPGYMQRSMLSVALQSIVQEFKSGRKMLSGGDFRQVGGEFLFENGRVLWCHRMKNTRDHAEIPDVRKQLGLDGALPPKRDRWSTAGLGQGLGRKLSERRRSWGGSRSRSRNTEKGKISPPRSTMEGVTEEGTNDGTQEDALAKLTANANGHANEGATEEKMGNGVVADENHANGGVIEEKMGDEVVANEKTINDGPRVVVNGTAHEHIVA